MKKASKKKPETPDFGKGERGKYAKRYAEGTNVIVLDPDVAAVFCDAVSVNEALRALSRIAPHNGKKPTQAEQHTRVVLPDDFANGAVLMERVGPNELRLRKKKKLADLIAAITPENLHGEWDTGPDVGKEAV